MLVVIFTFFVLTFMKHFTNSSVAFDIVPSGTDIDVKITGVETSKKSDGRLCRIHRLHERFFTQHGDLFVDVIDNDSTRLLVRT